MTQAATEYRFSAFPATPSGKAGNLSGVIVPYDTIANMGSFRERFEPGSIERGESILLNQQHDRRIPLARTGAGLTLTDTPEALRCEVVLPDTRLAREARELVEAGILTGFSIEMIVTGQRWEGDLRIIKRARMFGCSLVDTPAYGADAGVAMRHKPVDPVQRCPAWL